MTRPPADFAIENDLVSALLRSFAPELANEPLGARFEGWDNVTVRVGACHAARLPRLKAAVELIEVEQRWVPGLAERLPVAVPAAVLVAEPSDLFPAPWSIVPWIEGDGSGAQALSREGLEDLGKALAALHVAAPADAPVCPWRATSLASRQGEFIERIADGPEGLDIDAAAAMYSAAASAQSDFSTWIHADIHALNLVVGDGRLVGILDWGEMSRGDALVDLAQSWVLVGEEAFGRVLAGYGRALEPQEWVVLKGHAADAATRLATARTPAHHVPARRALVELGLLGG